MTIFIVNDNSDELYLLSDLVYDIASDDEIIEFDNPLSALAAAREQQVDVAFVNTKLPELDGISLGQYLKDLNPNINIIFTDETGDKALDAIRMHASGYMLKPSNNKDLKYELEELRFPEFGKMKKRVFAQTFGNFEIFVDGEPIAFKYNKTKEIVALLINNRGAQTTNGEIIASLWEDDGDPYRKTSYLNNLRQDLQNTFRRLKIDDIIVKQRGSLSIAPDKIECDLYDYLENKNKSRYRFTGTYMNQYSWSEYYLSDLDDLRYELEEEL